MSAEVELFIQADGSLMAIYTDALDFRALAGELGELTIARASQVEPTPDGRWQADMALSGGPLLPAFDTRREALDAEVAWIREHRLGVRPCSALGLKGDAP